jgi:Na+-transporting methylmalonyl-CoA/oxaloacetate decarboxylase gamma subunit
MSVDWGQAFQVGVIGFALVFFVLIILAIAMWLIGWVFNKSINFKTLFKRKKKIQSADISESKPKEDPEYNPRFKIDNIDRYE